MQVKKWVENSRNPILISVSFVIIGILIYGIVLTSIPDANTENCIKPNPPFLKNWGYDGFSFSLYWQHIFNVTSYHIYQSTNNIDFTEIGIVFGIRTFLNVYNLDVDSIYYFKAISVYGDGCISVFSNVLVLNTSIITAPPM